MSQFDVIAFDADDTLWHNEGLFSMTQDRFKQLLARYHTHEWIDQRLFATEMRNLAYFGYGIKGFTLSMIETAIELTEGQIRGNEIQVIIDFAKEMLTAPVDLLDHVQEVIERLAKQYPLMIITKGDLFDQQSKIARSGLASHFTYVEVVTEKTPETFAAILKKHNIAPERFLMVGNSLKSDIVPVVAIGGRAVYIPYHLTWMHETVTQPSEDKPRYIELEHIGQLPALIELMNLNS